MGQHVGDAVHCDQFGHREPAGADLAAVQRIMRHTDPRITMEFYAHLAPGYLRNAIERLAINPGEPEVLAAPLLQALGEGKSARAATPKKRRLSAT